jgi:predicted signal transduction protein with EAL and GGDEF domain
MENRARLLRDPVTGEPTGWVVTMRDTSDRKALEEKLSSHALPDGLTGIPNRRAFDRALALEWKRTLREGSQISLLLLDIDISRSSTTATATRWETTVCAPSRRQ